MDKKGNFIFKVIYSSVDTLTQIKTRGYSWIKIVRESYFY